MAMQVDAEGRVRGCREQHQRDPEDVGLGRLAEVVPPGGPVGTAGFLGERRVGHEAGEESHAEDLVRERERERRAQQGKAAGPGVVAPLADEDGAEEGQREEADLGAHERAEAEQDRRRVPQAAVTGGPDGEHREAPAEPRERQSVLEPARRELPHRRHDRDEERTHRQPPGAGAGDVGRQPDRAEDREPDAQHRQRDPHEDRDPLESQRQHDVGDDEERDPQRAGRRLDPFSGVEDGPVSGEHFAHDPQVDEPVVGHEARVPRARGDDHERNEQDQPGHDRGPVDRPAPVGDRVRGRSRCHHGRRLGRDLCTPAVGGHAATGRCGSRRRSPRPGRCGSPRPRRRTPGPSPRHPGWRRWTS